MLIDCDVFGLGSVKSFIAGPRFHKLSLWQREQMLLSDDEMQGLTQNNDVQVLIWWALSVMSGVLSGINRLCSVVPHASQHCLCLCSLSPNTVIVFKWNCKVNLWIAVLSQIYRLSYEFIYLEFVMQFYTKYHRVILGVTGSVIPRDTLFIRIMIMKLVLVHDALVILLPL